MNVYLSVIVILLILFFVEYKNHKNKTLQQACFYIGAISVFSIIAFRGTEVGGDTSAYVNFFIGKHSMYGNIDNSDMEVGFIFISRILRFINGSTLWFLFSSSLITMLPFFMLIKKYSINKTLPLLLFMTVWAIFPTAVCAVRQNFAVALMMFAYILYKEKVKLHLQKTSLPWKWIAVVVAICVLSILTHTSMLVALPLLLVSEYVHLSKKTSYVIVLGSFLLVLAVQNLFESLFSVFNAFTKTIEYADRMNGYFENSSYDLTNEVSFNRLAPATLLVLFYIFKSNEKEMKSVFLKCLVWGNALFCIGASFPLISRSVYLLLFMGIVYVPVSLYDTRKQISNILLVFLLLFFVRTQFKYFDTYNIKENYYGVRLLPYNTIFKEL